MCQEGVALPRRQAGPSPSLAQQVGEAKSRTARTGGRQELQDRHGHLLVHLQLWAGSREATQTGSPARGRWWRRECSACSVEDNGSRCRPGPSSSCFHADAPSLIRS
ncbi:hypothetical protein L345_00992, partial [Ophiophagus hannah]